MTVDKSVAAAYGGSVTTGRIPWRPLFVVGWFALSALLLIPADWRYLMFMPNDWQVWTWIPGWMAEGTLYDQSHWIVWSPPMNWLLAFIVVPLGYAVWWAAHLLSLLTLERSLVLLAVLSVPFWSDAMNGQTVTFQMVAGALALRGHRAGQVAFLALAVLIPRPLVVPLLAWLLWREPWTRLLFLGMGIAVVGAAFLSGDLAPWLGNMLAIGRDNYGHFANLSPTKFVGAYWLLIGLPLAAWLTTRKRFGLAGLAMSPYILPAYLLVLLWEWSPSSSGRGSPISSSLPDPLRSR